jgi:membrane protein DedA with SNARE-associated domain
MYEFLLNIYSGYSYLSYPLITGLTIIEGPIVSVMLGSIVKLGFLNVYLAYFSVVLGDLIGDCFLYYLGYRYGDKVVEKVQTKIKVTHEKVESIKNQFHTQKYKILFLSKISNGFGLSSVILLAAGIVRVPFYLFFLVNLCGQLIWSAALIALGYWFVGIYQQIEGLSGKLLLTVFIVAVIIYYFYNKHKNIYED